MKYYVSFAVDGRYVAEVEADNLRDAKFKAMDNVGDTDFGELRNVEAEMVVVEDESGAYVWQK